MPEEFDSESDGYWDEDGNFHEKHKPSPPPPPQTKAIKLDEAWDIYSNQANAQDSRLVARDFIIDLLDLHLFKLLDPKVNLLEEPGVLDELLHNLMNLRQEHKEKGNLDYIPIITSGNLQFDINAQEIKPIEQGPIPQEVQKALDEKNLLDVTPKRKAADKDNVYHQKLDRFERDKHNIQISKGLFYQDGVRANTSGHESHSKQNYASFTMNSNGEISIFTHYGKKRGEEAALHHSSMNADAPVVAAGEIEIKAGKLISLSNYSGHYQPSLYSVYRFLDYLASRGIDISQTNVYLQQKPDPATTGLAAVEVRQQRLTAEEEQFFKKFTLPKNDPRAEIEYEVQYKVAATDIVYNNKAIMNKHIQSLNQFLQNFNESKREDNSLLKLANSFLEELIYVATFLKSASSYSELQQFFDFQESMIARYQQELDKHPAITSMEKGMLSMVMKEMVKEYKENRKVSQDLPEEKRVEAFKKTF